MEYPTLPQRLLESVDRYHSPRAQIYKAGSQWQDISAKELLRRVAGVARALVDLGVREGDRVAVFAPNCPEWHIVDFAVLGLGAVTVPIYFRESLDRMTYILNHAEVSAVFVSGEEQTARLLGIHAQVPSVRHVLIANGGANGGANSGAGASGNGATPTLEPTPGAFAGSLVSYHDAIAQAGDAQVKAYRERAASFGSAQLASIIYTSGTTGEPKGVMLSHANFVSNEIASFERFRLRPGRPGALLPAAVARLRAADRLLLPVSRTSPWRTWPARRTSPQALSWKSARPSPRPCRAFSRSSTATVMERGAQATGLRRHLFDWAVRIARRAIPWRAYGRPVSPMVKLQWELADPLRLQKIPRRRRRPHPHVHLRRRPAGHRARRILHHRRHAHLARLRPDGNLAGSQQQHHRRQPHRHRRPPLARRRSAHRRRRRDPGPRPAA